MKEINIARSITAKRKEKGMTQEQLAAYMGVSKASVSKWETGQSYPDITFLPQLATYFNITIDELVGYSPQMTKEDIRALYHRLSAAFGSRPVDEVLSECRAAIKDYYACFPLLLQMAVLLINHHMLAKEKETQKDLLEEAIGLCVRIKTESEDVWLSKQANSMEALCRMALQQPLQVLELLDGTMKPMLGDEAVLASAYQMRGDLPRAKKVLQVSIYQHLMSFVGTFPFYLQLYVQEPDRFETVLARALAVSGAFELDSLHPNTTLQIYFAAAQGYAIQGDAEKALDMLGRYADICTAGFFPLTLHGDGFFDSIDEWFDEFDLGPQPPRDEKVVKASMIQSVVQNPAFSALAGHPGYQRIIETMKTKLGGN